MDEKKKRAYPQEIFVCVKNSKQRNTLMKNFDSSSDKNQFENSTRSVLDEHLRAGARTLLQEALELEAYE